MKETGGFTLIEIMIVLMIMSLVIGVVAPQGSKIYGKMKTYLEQKHYRDVEKRAYFTAFILDEECRLTTGKGVSTLECNGQELFREKSASMPGTVTIGSKGLPVEE